VVLEAGSGGTAATMAWLHRSLAEHATVVAYDRAGYGFIDASVGDWNASAVVADLHDALDALDALGLDEPLVLVGHSLGGAYIRVFVAEHAGAVAAVVVGLLDELAGSSGRPQAG
jgi:pimeloyl-ACP methyl ester carboxylesterase